MEEHKGLTAGVLTLSRSGVHLRVQPWNMGLIFQKTIYLSFSSHWPEPSTALARGPHTSEA